MAKGMESRSVDVLIIGGGMVGASLAAGLAGTALDVVVAEAFPLRAAGQPSYDDRSTAIAWGTSRVFDRLGLWSAMSPEASAIHRIHVSEQGRFGVTRIDRRQQRVPALGFVVPNRAMGSAFASLFEANAASGSGPELLAPARLVALEPAGERAEARFEVDAGELVISARLVVAADGAASTARELLNIGAQVHDYRQTAIISNVTPSRRHANTAFERFTAAGPVALLPYGDDRCNLIYTVRSEDAEAAMALDDAAFLEALQDRIGWRLGRMEQVGRRVSYPLRQVMSSASVCGRVVLIGNAAHSLHPVAGQGFNLGLRDAMVLAELLGDAAAQGEDLGGADLLRQYSDRRRTDQRNVSTFTDALARVFERTGPVSSTARSLGLLAVDLLPPVKRGLASATMGRGSGLPRILRDAQ
jgi:2-octaprenyl-6-methoxyphenol hydroxylase